MATKFDRKAVFNDNGGFVTERLGDNGSDSLFADPTAVVFAKALLGRYGYDVKKKPADRSFSGFLRNVRDAGNTKRPELAYEARKALEKSYGTDRQQIKGVEKAAMTETQGNLGGYLLPIDYSLALMDVIAEESFIWPRANVVPMDSLEMELPKIDVETIPASGGGISPFFGGIRFVWTGSTTLTETEPKFRSLVLHAWDLIGYALMSNQMLADTGAEGEARLLRLFGKAAAWYAEYAFLQGLGASSSQPTGIVTAPGSLLVTRNTAGTIKINDIFGMTTSLLPFSWGNAIWAASPTALSGVQNLAQYFINIEIGDLHKKARQAAGVLSTFPMFLTEKLPPIGTKGDLILFDPSLYVIGNRMDCLVDVSPDDKFQNNQTTYRIWMRLDGKCYNSSSITMQDSSSKVSPFVVLV